MNSNLVLATMLAVVFVCLVKESEGRLQCYLCEQCFDLSKARTGDCPGSCAIAKYPGHVIRTCLPKVTDYCETKTNGSIISGELCYCNNDLCNGGSIDNGESVERLSVMLCMTILVVMVLKAMV